MDAQKNDTVSSVKGRYQYLIFWSSAVLLFLWALGYRGLWASEGRWAEITREMFLSGDFFHPTINGEPYFDKPLLSYWLIALVSHTTGKLNEWAIRLPSAVSCLLALWAMVSLGRRLWSEKVAITAGWILLTTYGILFWSRTGSADMENLAVVIIAVAWYWARRERPGFLTFLVFYLICFLGAHAKGLPAVVIPVLAVLPDVIRERRWKRLLSFSHVLALAIGITFYIIPFIYADITSGEYRASGLALVFKENVLRYFKPFDHKEPFYVYLYYLPELFLPWTPLFLIAIWGTFASFKKLDKKTRWLAEAIVVIFLFFTFSGSRRSYYILPILPFCALLTSLFFVADGKDRRAHLGFSIQEWGFAMVSLCAIASLAIWPIIRSHTGFVPPADLLTATPILGILSLFALILNRLRPGLQADFLGTDQKIAPCVFAAVILMGGFFCLQLPSLDVYRGERPFAMELKSRVAGLSPEQVAFYGTIMTNTLFYLDQPKPVRMLTNTESVQIFLESCKGDKFFITTEKYLKELKPVLPAEVAENPTLREKVYPWERNNSKNLVAWLIRAK